MCRRLKQYHHKILLVQSWQSKEELMKGSFTVSEIQEQYNFFNNARETLAVTKLPSQANIKTTEIHKQLLYENARLKIS